jgi:protein-S-isoprenylcysteine O-methyltransferase Ste14
LVLRTLISTSIVSLLPFVVSGRWDWLVGWAYVGLSLLLSMLTQAVLAWRYPELWVERVTSLEKEGVKPWDRWLVPFISILGPALLIGVAGLDVRYGWSPELPLAAHLGGLVGILLGYSIGSWALFSNPFFSGVVRIQTERGHRVVSHGPYRFVRHPGYAGNLLYYLGVPLFFGTLWAYLPAALLLLITVIRTALEDRTLQAELHGYASYAGRVHFRLLPGVW